jgi:hypothetical protein
MMQVDVARKYADCSVQVMGVATDGLSRVASSQC